MPEAVKQMESSIYLFQDEDAKVGAAAPQAGSRDGQHALQVRRPVPVGDEHSKPLPAAPPTAGISCL